ncbi:MAG: PTS system mannitol-specific EIICBA component [Sodalis sp.]|nr:MAG: PTS system mannitol-specific EIICBA component [Sodalis sp.]
MSSANIKVRAQNFGRFLSNTVIPNIGAFIARGITYPPGVLHRAVYTYALDIKRDVSQTGLANDYLPATVADWLYRQSEMVGVIVGVGGLAIKRFDRLIDGKIKKRCW